MKKIKVIVKHCGCQPFEHKAVPDGRVMSKLTPVMIASDLCLLFRKHARVLDHSFNANICGVDFHGLLVFAGYDGDKLTDVPFDLNKFKILFPDLFLEE